jgi:hypothetical protein
VSFLPSPPLAESIASVLWSITSQSGDMVLNLVNAHEGDLNSSDFVKNIMQSDGGISFCFKN